MFEAKPAGLDGRLVVQVSRRPRGGGAVPLDLTPRNPTATPATATGL
jgi:hypothetical protein